MDNIKAEAKDSKKEFDALVESETKDFKITLLEKHLMESREAFNELKQQELELREKQAAVIDDMQKAAQEAKRADLKVTDEIKNAVEGVKTEMFESWQEEVRDALVNNAAELLKAKTEEYDAIYKAQNAVIEKQSAQIKKMLTSYRILKILCCTLVALAAIVFVLLPGGQYVYEQISVFLQQPSWWGGVILVVAAIIAVSAVVLAAMLGRRDRKSK